MLVQFEYFTDEKPAAALDVQPLTVRLEATSLALTTKDLERWAAEADGSGAPLLAARIRRALVDAALTEVGVEVPREEQRAKNGPEQGTRVMAHLMWQAMQRLVTRAPTTTPALDEVTDG